MSTLPSINDLQNVSDELELFGIPPLPLKRKKYLDASDEEMILPALVDSLWKLMVHQRHANQSSQEEEEENRCLKRDNARLNTEIALVKKKLSSARDNTATLIAHDKVSNKVSAATERHVKMLRRDADVLTARLETTKTTHEQQVKRKDAEIEQLNERIKQLVQTGSLRTANKTRTKSCSEKEALLKQVICKYQEMNQTLVEENSSLRATVEELKKL